ncbi:hypothetical protein KAR91_73120 [Candidatus Pacearchaeota archaeon]|nr:hypothetical protein [Candidatus Pacearchaeota archaeon]
MIKSPCRTCKDHATKFPKCYEKCEELRKVQQANSILGDTYVKDKCYVREYTTGYVSGKRRSSCL